MLDFEYEFVYASRVVGSGTLNVSLRGTTDDREEQMDSPRDDNIWVLPVPAGRNDLPAEVLDMLGHAVQALNEIGDSFARIDPSPHWSPARWSAASMAFCMRLAPAEQRLTGLRQIDPADWPEIAWSIELSSARADFEQELQAVVRLLDMLLRHDLSPGERAWQAQRFTSGGKGFLESLQHLRAVIVGRYPGTRRLP